MKEDSHFLNKKNLQSYENRFTCSQIFLKNTRIEAIQKLKLKIYTTQFVLLVVL